MSFKFEKLDVWKKAIDFSYKIHQSKCSKL